MEFLPAYLLITELLQITTKLLTCFQILLQITNFVSKSYYKITNFSKKDKIKIVIKNKSFLD